MREKGEDFQYRLDRSVDDYLENWFVTRDLMCRNSIEYNSSASFYMIGFGLGIVFFFLPDTLGRRGTMRFFIPIQLFSCYLAHYA